MPSESLVYQRIETDSFLILTVCNVRSNTRAIDIRVISYHYQVSMVVLVYFPSCFLTYRIVWFFVLMAAMATCVMEVSLRTFDYFSYETNVDFRVLYGDKVTFPAVTICNQNNFRYHTLL